MPDMTKNQETPEKATILKVQELGMHLIDVDGRFRLREEDGPNIEALAENIREVGQTTPVFVAPTAQGRYVLVAGYRRYAALGRLGRSTVVARVFEGMSESTLFDLAISENAQREDMNNWEKIQICARLFERGESNGEIARRFGWTERHAQTHVALHRVTTEGMKRALRTGTLSVTHARLFAEKVLGNPVLTPHEEALLRGLCDEGWSVRDFVRRVEHLSRKEATAESPKGKKPTFVCQVSKGGTLHLRLSYKPGMHDLEETRNALRAVDERLTAMKQAYFRERRSKEAEKFSERSRRIEERRRQKIERAKTEAAEAQRAARIAREQAAERAAFCARGGALAMSVSGRAEASTGACTNSSSRTSD